MGSTYYIIKKINIDNHVFYHLNIKIMNYSFLQNFFFQIKIKKIK